MFKGHGMRTGICAISLLLLWLPAGCGGDDKSEISKDEQGLRIEQFQSDVRSYCLQGRHDLTGAADPLGTVLTAVDSLIKVYRDDPDATYVVAKYAKTGDKLAAREASIRDLVTESKETLNKRCGKYGRDQARRLEATLSS
jgi:hypothetical protein